MRILQTFIDSLSPSSNHPQLKNIAFVTVITQKQLTNFNFNCYNISTSPPRNYTGRHDSFRQNAS